MGYNRLHVRFVHWMAPARKGKTGSIPGPSVMAAHLDTFCGTGILVVP